MRCGTYEDGTARKRNAIETLHSLPYNTTSALCAPSVPSFLSGR